MSAISVAPEATSTKTLADLAVGDKIILKRNLDHPAWQKPSKTYDEYSGTYPLVRDPVQDPQQDARARHSRPRSWSDRRHRRSPLPARRRRRGSFLFVGFFVSLIASAFSIQASSDGLARFRGEVVSEYLKETYDVNVSFTEDGVQPTNLDGLTVYDKGSVYRITVAADDSILLVDDGGREVPRVDQ